MADNEMSAKEWLAQFAAALDMVPPTEEEFDQLLELAASAAHGSERVAAPIACWIAGQTSKPLSELNVLAEGISAPSS